jgi:hypothetical protein
MSSEVQQVVELAQHTGIFAQIGHFFTDQAHTISEAVKGAIPVVMENTDKFARTLLSLSPFAPINHALAHGKQGVETGLNIVSGGASIHGALEALSAVLKPEGASALRIQGFADGVRKILTPPANGSLKL